jgi:citrate lyase subunit beta / citryl-CoA lyase
MSKPGEAGMSRVGEAGKREAGVRSDCWIGVELRDRGGVTLDLQSKVAALYGAAIEAQLREGCNVLGVAHAALTVIDAGALPYVLAARLEAAVRRAGHVPPGPWLLPARADLAVPGDRARLRRSRLYLPGNEPKFFANAGLHGPDGLILDLEDSVAPAEKDAARVLVRNALRALDFHGAERMVRINQGERGLADLEWIVPHGVQLVLLPKVEDPAQVRDVAARIADLRRVHGGAEPIHLMPIVESALGAWRAYEIAAACPEVVGLAIGLEDYTADIGAQRTLAGTESLWARAQVLNGARAAGVQPIDTVFSDVADEAGLRAAVLEAKSLGFVGKGCIHPRQIAVVHDAFAPAADEIDRAVRIVRAYEDAEARGLGVVSLGTKMIDAPVVKRALATVDLAVRMGRLDAEWRDMPPPPAKPAAKETGGGE